ncbi:MAG: GTP 3',8-cyclase MoaA [Peptoniphilus sp. oral taxon 375]|nr:GTP 3',8-cyclase MoaA [Peptoniphilus sp. oral taxon 375]
MKDKFQREINYLRVSITDLCNFRCGYCMPQEGLVAKSRQEILTLEEIYYLVHTFVEKGINKVRLTGGEPLLRKNVLALIESLGKIEKIKDFALTSNGYLLKDYAQDLKAAGIQRVNLSLDTLNAQKFEKITHYDGFDKVWQGLEEALNVGLGVKINAVLMKGINDDEIGDLIQLTKDYPLDLRFIELMPIGQTQDFAQKHFLSCDEVLKFDGLLEVERDDPHSPAQLYRLEGAQGRVGLIRPISQHFCQTCNRLRLTSDGKVKPCLHSDSSLDLMTPLRKGQDIRPLIDRAIQAKPERHHLLERQTSQESMNRIGG